MQEFLSRWMAVDASAHGARLDSLTVWVHWLMAILFVGWLLYFIFVLFRFRASANPKASYEGAQSHFSSYIEAGVAVVEVVLLVGFAIPAWAAWTTTPEGTDVFEVRVVAQQFAWNIRYSGPDGQFGRIRPELIDDAAGNPLGLDREDPAGEDDLVVPTMAIPVNRPIDLILRSKDVTHNFSVRELRLKQDTVPGMMTPLRFTATKTGKYEIACSELCGLGHHRMRSFLDVLSDQGYAEWLEDQSF